MRKSSQLSRSKLTPNTYCRFFSMALAFSSNFRDLWPLICLISSMKMWSIWGRLLSSSRTTLRVFLADANKFRNLTKKTLASSLVSSTGRNSVLIQRVRMQPISLSQAFLASSSYSRSKMQQRREQQITLKKWSSLWEETMAYRSGPKVMLSRFMTREFQGTANGVFASILSKSSLRPWLLFKTLSLSTFKRFGRQNLTLCIIMAIVSILIIISIGKLIKEITKIRPIPSLPLWNASRIYKYKQALSSYQRQSQQMPMKTLGQKQQQICLVCSKNQEDTRKKVEKFERKAISPRISSLRIKLRHLPKDKFCQLLLIISQTARFITNLQLQNNQISSITIQLIAKAGWKFICSVNLSKTSLSDTAVSKLRLVHWEYLKHLDLSFNPIKNKGVEYICRCPFPRLESLLLKKTNATICCFQSVAKGQWPKLKELSFCGTLLGNLDLSFLQLLGWSVACQLNLTTKDYCPGLGWSGYLAKVPKGMAQLKLILCTNHVRLNSETSIQNLLHAFPNANKLYFVWKTQYIHLDLQPPLSN